MQNVTYCNNGEAGLKIIAELPNTNDFFLCYHALAVCPVPLFSVAYWRDADKDILHSNTWRSW